MAWRYNLHTRSVESVLRYAPPSELGDNPDLLLGKDRLQDIEQIEQQFVPRLKKRRAQQWFTEGRK